MKQRFLLVLTTTLLTVSCATSTPQALPTPGAGEALYVVDPSHTFPHFEISHMGFSNHHGRFDKTTGWILLDRATRSGSMEIKIDADSIDTGDAKLEKRLRDEDFFFTERYPTITFRSTRMKFDGERLVTVEGELSIRDATKPVTLNVTAFRCGPHPVPVMKSELCGANAETTINRQDFGVSAYPGLIGNRVRLTLQIEAEKR